MLNVAPSPFPPVPVNVPSRLAVPVGVETDREPPCPPDPALTSTALPPASAILPVALKVTVPPGLATLTPSYCCTTPATLIAAPEPSDRLPAPLPPVAINATLPEGSRICVSTSMLDPLTLSDPPSAVVAKSVVEGVAGASKDTAPAADKFRSTPAPVVMRDAVMPRSPLALSAPSPLAVSEMAAARLTVLKPDKATLPPLKTMLGAWMVSAPEPAPVGPAVAFCVFPRVKVVAATKRGGIARCAESRHSGGITVMVCALASTLP